MIPRKIGHHTAATAPRPSCKPHAGSVYVFCGSDVLEKWGIGPEGETGAIGNCNDGCNSGIFTCPVKPGQNLGMIDSGEGDGWKGGGAAVVTQAEEKAKSVAGCVAFGVNAGWGVQFTTVKLLLVPWAMLRR